MLTYELEQSQKRQRDLYVDLDSRLRKLEGAPGRRRRQRRLPPPAAAAAGAAPPPAPTAGRAPPRRAGVPTPPPSSARYDAALDQFKRGNYPARDQRASQRSSRPIRRARSRRRRSTGSATRSSRSKDYRGAIASQRQLIATYPDSQKVPDALLNIASAQFELGDAAAARRTLEELIAKYPQSEAAAKARQRLGQR